MLGRGEEVQNAAAAGELARALDLLGALIAAAQQGRLDLLHRIAAAAVDHESGLFQRLGRHRALQQARDRRRGQPHAAASQPVQRGEALLLTLARDGLGRKKGIVAHAERFDLLAEHGAQVVGKILGRGVIRGDDEDRAVERLAERRGQIGPVHRRKPGNERRKSSALQQGGEGGNFLIFKYLLN